MSDFGLNRRRLERFDTTLVVRRPKGQAPMIAHDLSLGGMQVSTAVPLWPGQGFEATLVLRGIGSVRVDCRVNELVEIPCGIGLSLIFVRLTKDAENAIACYLQELRRVAGAAA